MKTTIIAVAIGLMSVAFDARCCECEYVDGVLLVRPPPDVEFTGKVASIRDGIDPTSSERLGVLDVCFDNASTQDGAVANQICVWTSASSHSCGYPFQIGRTYVVRAERQSEERPDLPLYTSVCLGTFDVGAEVDPTRVTHHWDERATLIAFVAIVLAAVVIALWRVLMAKKVD